MKHAKTYVDVYMYIHYEKQKGLTHLIYIWKASARQLRVQKPTVRYFAGMPVISILIRYVDVGAC